MVFLLYFFLSFVNLLLGVVLFKEGRGEKFLIYGLVLIILIIIFYMWELYILWFFTYMGIFGVN